MPQQAFAGLMCSTIGVASKHSNTNKIDAENGVSKLSEAAKEERKKIVSNYHMRVSKKGDPSQIGNKYQRKEEL